MNRRLLYLLFGVDLLVIRDKDNRPSAIWSSGRPDLRARRELQAARLHGQAGNIRPERHQVVQQPGPRASPEVQVKLDPPIRLSKQDGTRNFTVGTQEKTAPL